MTTHKNFEFFLFLLVFTFSFSFISASPFGYDIETMPGTYTYFVNNSYLSIANGTGTFVMVTGDIMTGPLNITGSGANLLINQNTATAISSILGTTISARGADNGIVRIAISSYGLAGMGAFANRHSRGTAASPSALQRGDTIFSLEGWGYGATAYSTSARAMIRAYAANIWNDTSQSSYMSFFTSNNHTIVPEEKMRIDDKGINITDNLVVNGNFSSRRAFYYGYDNSTQQFSNIANSQVLNISNNADISAWQISVENKQNITFQTTGEYLIALSPEFFQSSGGTALVTFWIQVTNSTGQFNDIAWSNSRYTIPNAAYNAPIIEYPIRIATTSDKVRFMWWSDSTNTQIYSSGALTSPTRPSIPGVLLNIRKSSALT